MKGLLISVTEPEQPGVPGRYLVDEFDGDLPELQAAVGGLVDIFPTDSSVTVWINDDGLGRFPVNRLAMDVLLRWDAHRLMLAGAAVWGNVVITGGGDRHGNTLDLPAAARRWVQHVAFDAGALDLT